MQRTLKGIAIASCLLFLLVSTRTVAQQSATKGGAAAVKKTTPVVEGTCNKHDWAIHHGVCRRKVQKLFDNEPEFAILRLSAEQYKDFQKDPKEFLNKHETFDKPVRKATTFSEAKPETDPPGDAWYVMVAHWPGSTASGKAFPASSPPE
jgi:hypothetical protein